jgi:PAS domain-containing protein
MNQDQSKTHPAPSAEQSDKIAQTVQTLMARHNAEQPLQMRKRRAAVAARSVEVARAIRQAWQLGYRIQRVENLRPIHCTRLLEAWQQRDLSRATVARRWDALRDFCDAVGKPGMLQRLEAVWPEEPTAKASATFRRRQTLASISDQTYQQILGRLDDTRPVYWVLRLERELGLTREEALLTNLVVASVRCSTGNLLPVSKAGGLEGRVVEIRSDEQRELVASAVRFLKRCERERLCWRLLSPEAAIAKVKNALSYQLRLPQVATGEGDE